VSILRGIRRATGGDPNAGNRQQEKALLQNIMFHNHEYRYLRQEMMKHYNTEQKASGEALNLS
jgi:hypothetical protein